jgi:hypothetical protein
VKRADTLPPLWTCPTCGAKFVTANMWHSCGRYRVDDLFAKSDPHVLRLYARFKRMVEACGPVIVVPQKTRLCFMVRMRFAGVYPRKSYLRATFLLTRRLADDPRIEKVTTYAPRCIGYELHIDRPGQLDATVQRWLKEAYDVGAQKDFVRHGNAARRRSG